MSHISAELLSLIILKKKSFPSPTEYSMISQLFMQQSLPRRTFYWFSVWSRISECRQLPGSQHKLAVIAWNSVGPLSRYVKGKHLS